MEEAIDEIGPGTSTTPSGAARTMSGPAIASAAESSSLPYQYASEIDNGNENVTATNELGDLYGRIERGPDPDSLFHESHQENMVNKLLEYNARGPSPTQCNDEEWGQIMGSVSNSGTSHNRGIQRLEDCPFPSVETSPPVITTNRADAVNSPATDLDAMSAIPPATPRPTSRKAAALENSSTPPSLKVPKSSQGLNFPPQNLAVKEESEIFQYGNADSNELKAVDFSEPGETLKDTSLIKLDLSAGDPFSTPQTRAVRRITPLIQSPPTLGDPFTTPPVTRARRPTVATTDMFGSPLPSASIQPPANAKAISPPMWKGQNNHFGGSMPKMTSLSSHAAPIKFQSPPNPANFMNKLHNTNSLEPNTLQLRQPAMKRMRVNSMGPGDLVPSIDHDHQTQRQAYVQNELRSGTVNPQMISNNLIHEEVSWHEYLAGTASPQSTIPPESTLGYQVPFPNGKIGDGHQEAIDETLVGQKRTASQMMRANMDGGHGQSPSESGGSKVTRKCAENYGLFVPHNQGSSAMSIPMRSRAYQSQPAMEMQPSSQSFHMNQFSSPMRAHMAGQLKGKLPGQSQQDDQKVMHAQAQAQNQFMCMSPGSQIWAMQQLQQLQQYQQGQPGTPQNPFATPRQIAVSSPSSSNLTSQGTSTPASRRRATLSRAGRSVLSSSPLNTSGRVKKTPNSSNKRRAPSQNATTATPPDMPPVGYGHTSSKAKPLELPASMRDQFQAFTQTPPSTGTASSQTPAALRAHLPTPQRPISTGSCPNTVNETLEETNRRTEAQLRALGAPICDFDPHFNQNTASDDIFGGYSAMAMPNYTGNEPTGLHMANLSFTDMMGADMSLGFGSSNNVGMNKKPPNPSGAFNLNVGLGGSPGTDDEPANLRARVQYQSSLLNSVLRASPPVGYAGYAETIVSETVTNTPTPVIDEALPPNMDSDMRPTSGAKTPANEPEIARSTELDVVMTSDTDAPGSTAVTDAVSAAKAATDGLFDAELDPLITNSTYAEDIAWLESYDEHAEFDPAIWGI